MKGHFNERIIKIVEHYNLNNSSFGRRIGRSPQTVRNVVEGDSKPSFEIIEAILLNFNEINPEWLLIGKGEMFKTIKEDSGIIEFLKKEIEMYRKRESIFLGMIPDSLGKLFDVSNRHFVFSF